MSTDWTILGPGVVAVCVAGYLLHKRSSLISEGEARTLLQQGATIIDVRTASEYQSRHLTGAINVPLDSVRDRIGGEIHDKEAALLLHCVAGVRSGMAKRILRKLGYSNAHNLGSYRRAERIVGEWCSSGHRG